MKKSIVLWMMVALASHLEARRSDRDFPPVSWNKMNELFGTALWQDEHLWDDPTETVAKRMKMSRESKTEFMENYRAYPLGRKKMLSEPVYATALYGKNGHANSLSFVFLNLGDVPARNKSPSGEEMKEITERIEQCSDNIYDTLSHVFGEAERDSIGKGDMREKVWRWNWNDHALLLSMQEGKYVILRILSVEVADLAGKPNKLKGTELRERMASCVERRDNGDVIINNIPMINQGPKGYCSPATWERYLRYLDIPADMYQLALLADTGIGGGTYADNMISATDSLLSKNGCSLRKIGEELDINTIARYIDRGMPVMWHFLSTPAFQREANNNTAIRNGKTPEPIRSGQSEDSSSGGHVCLIVGYNKQTEEIAISDSWGPKFNRRWVSVDQIEESSYSMLNVIKW